MNADESGHVSLQLPALQGSISVQQLDLSDLASVRAAAAELQRLPRIDYMILNAGVMVGVAIWHRTVMPSCCQVCCMVIDVLCHTATVDSQRHAAVRCRSLC